MYCRPDNRGFTLIEILVAILLFTFGALLAARMQTTSLRGNTFGKEALAATTAAQTLMEQLKDPTLTPFATLLGGSGFAQVRPDSNPGNIQAGTGGALPPLIPGMLIQWTVNNTTGTAALNNRYTTVTVNVQWAANTRSYSTTTVISEIP